VELKDLIIDDTAAGIFRVHRSTMTSPDVLALEREHIFEHCWLFLGHESEVENRGDYRRRTVAGRPLIFVRGSDGEVRALYNTCLHRGARVCRQDEGSAETFQCFYHAWTYDNRGQLVGVPDEAGYGSGFDRRERSLQPAPRLDSYRGFYFVSFDRQIEDLPTYLAGAKEYIDLIADQSELGLRVLVGTQKNAIRANWKLYVENSIDGYHTLPLHTTYFAFLASQGMDRSQQITGGDAKSYNLGNGHSVLESPAPFGRPVALWHPVFGEAAREEIEHIRARLVERHGAARAYRMAETQRLLHIHPNLYIHDIAALTIRVIWPAAPDLLEVSAWALALKEETPSLVSRRLENFHLFLGPGGFATPDDVEALESCQEGFAAKEVEWNDISKGMQREPTFLDEVPMRAFWREWLARMLGRSHADQREARKAPPEALTASRGHA
jgi:p-cumate 2,3-dioxygenase alpha subunit